MRSEVLDEIKHALARWAKAPCASTDGGPHFSRPLLLFVVCVLVTSCFHPLVLPSRMCRCSPSQPRGKLSPAMLRLKHVGIIVHLGARIRGELVTKGVAKIMKLA
eukprot:5859459-Amphidinium_carterae.1